MASAGAIEPQAVGDRHRVGSDALFFICLIGLSSCYVIMIIGMVLADMSYTTPDRLLSTIVDNPYIRQSIRLSLLTCTTTTILSLWVAVPIGYLLARYNFRGKAIVDTVLDIPIVLPPLVVGLSLLILFKYPPFSFIAEHVVFEVPAVILAQFMVACAFSVRTMRIAFEQISPRPEQVALTLGCTRNQAFWSVVMPEARSGVLTAGTLAWARSLGEFGPVLIFAGSMRGNTEVLPTTVFLEFQAGHLTEALAVSMVMIITAMIVLVITRLFGAERSIL